MRVTKLSILTRISRTKGRGGGGGGRGYYRQEGFLIKFGSVSKEARVNRAYQQGDVMSRRVKMV